MTIDHVKADIPAYLHGDLPESRQRQIESHVAGCDSCRHLLNKARSKSARSKRQALKNANPDPLPNLLINRLGRQAGLNRPPGRGSWRWLFLLVVVTGGAYLLKRRALRPAVVSDVSSQPDVAISTSIPSGMQTTPPFDVEKSSPVTPVAVSSAPPAPPIEKAKPVAPAPPQTWSGADSSVKDFREIVINGRKSWRSLWEEMGHDSPAPPINFLDTIVVGVFAGEQPNAGVQVLLGPSKDLGEEVQIPYRMTTAIISSGTVTAVMHPYTLTTIPRVPKPVRLVRENS